MTTLNIYLTFEDECEAAFTFYKSVFGGEFADINRFGEMPADENNPIPEEYKDRIMHVVLPVGGLLLMGSDSAPQYGGPIHKGNNYSISINAHSKEEADRLFNGLSEGGQITMPIADTFWGAYFGMFTDKFGIHWMLNYDYPK